MVTYEWTVETIDEHGDIQDTSAVPSFADAISRKEASTVRVEICLVRHRWNDTDEDLEDRQWAYLEDGTLPDRFDGGAKVPTRYLLEIARL